MIKADTVNVSDNIIVSNNTTLNIGAGTVVLFTGPYSIFVEGCLIAEGTAEKRIVFTSTKPDDLEDYTTNIRSWGGIIFDKVLSTNDSSSIRYCILEYSKTIRKEDELMSGYLGGALFVNNFSKLKVENNIFRFNTAIYGAAIACINNCQPQINNNLFYRNYAQINGSVACFINSYPFFYNNTITDNIISEYDMNYQPGAVFNFRSKPFMANNIIRNSPESVSPQVHFAKEYFTFNNNIQGISGYNKNIDEDPDFDGGSELPGILLDKSPCINTGGDFNLSQPETDLLGNKRVVNGVIDIGAFENQTGSSVDQIPSAAGLLKIYPNPANPDTRISFLAETACEAEIRIYDIKGNLIEKISRVRAVKGNNSYDLKLDKYSGGLYIVKVFSPKKIFQGKLLLVK